MSYTITYVFVCLYEGKNVLICLPFTYPFSENKFWGYSLFDQSP